MGKVIMWKCERTKRLFETEREYQTHLKKLATHDAERKKQSAAKRAKERKLNKVFDLDSLEAVEQWVVKHCKIVGLEGMVRLKLGSMRFGEASITHSAPKGRRTNWSGRYHKRRHHCGWSGRLDICFKGEREDRFFSMSDKLKRVGIHSGTGGGGRSCENPACGYHYSWDTRAYAEDFPNIARVEALTDKGLRSLDPMRDPTLVAALWPTSTYYVVTQLEELFEKSPRVKDGYIITNAHFDEAVLMKMQGDVKEIVALRDIEDPFEESDVG